MLHMTSSPRKAEEFLWKVSRSVNADTEVTDFAYFGLLFFPFFLMRGETEENRRYKPIVECRLVLKTIIRYCKKDL